MKDTIAAISTTLGVGAIAIIRVSGEDAISIVNRIFKGKDLSQVESHTIHYGHIVENGENVDEVLVSVMKSPKTFTTEDVVEINCHGGIATTNKVLELVLENGARMAEPGEFTKRAFLNGRIDLTQAESVMDLINGDMTTNKIAPVLKSIQEKLHHIIEQSENGAILKNGIQTVIVGRPNVGKSSILNRLLKQDKAIVTDIAGTTRDLVEGSITISGVALDIIDTAGIRDTDNVVEKIGVDKSLSLIPKADLVIAVFNCNEVFNEEDKELLKKIDAHKSIIVLNKNDLPSKIDESVFEGYAVVHTNTKDVDGIDTLRNKIVELFHLDQLEKNDYTCLSNIRQIRLAKEAYQSILNAVSGAEQLLPPDMIEIDIKDAWSTLGEIIGETYSDELIDQLFSQFCLGK